MNGDEAIVEPERCLRCGEAAVIDARVAAGFSFFMRSHIWGHNNSTLVQTVPSTRVCVACGQVTASLDPARFREAMRGGGSELAKQYLDEIDFGPRRDLPDTGFGHDLGAKVAELDALARTGKDSAVIRRFRDLTATTWDEATMAAGRWSRLTREAKLALLGWTAKMKPIKDDLADSLF